MSDHEHLDPNEHIARLLREQGPVDAPPDLASDVMRQVRAEPRQARRPRVRWQPAVAFAAAAACLLALGVGIAHLSSGTATSGSGSGGGVAAEASKMPANDNSAASAGTYTVARKSALAILGSPLLPARPAGAVKTDGAASVARSAQGFKATASGRVYDQLARRLAYAAAHPGSGPTVVVVLTRRKR